MMLKLSERELSMTDNRNVPSNPQRENDRISVDEEDVLVDEAENAITEMEAHEQRRVGTYKSGGDDESPGIDTDIDSNAPSDPLRD